MQITQLVECLTGKPGAALTWVRVLGVARDFFPQSASDADSLTVSVQPHVCSHMPQHLCAHSKSQTLAGTPLFGHMEIQHTPTGMGSAALAAAVPYLGKVT